MNFAKLETMYEKDHQLLKRDCQAILSWASKQAHLPQIPELLMALFLHSCYYNSETTKKCVETFYTVKGHCPEFFANRDLRNNRSELLDTLWVIPLPKLTPAAFKVIFFKLGDLEVNKFSVPMCVQSFDISAFLVLLQESPVEGEILLVDFKGITLSHILRLNVSYLKKFFIYFQEAMPVRIVGIHIINVTSYIDKLLALIKPFMKKELYDLIHLHTDDLTELHNVIPPDCMPSDYNGSLSSLDELRETWHKNLLAHADYFLHDEKMIADESKRVGKPKKIEDVFGLDGTFRKLDVD